jgi:hypothetical protein
MLAQECIDQPLRERKLDMSQADIAKIRVTMDVTLETNGEDHDYLAQRMQSAIFNAVHEQGLLTKDSGATLAKNGLKFETLLTSNTELAAIEKPSPEQSVLDLDEAEKADWADLGSDSIYLGMSRSEINLIMNSSDPALQSIQEKIQEKINPSPRARDIFILAKRTVHDEGDLEIDDNCIVSEGDDYGAYVSAWKWVSFSDTELDQENSPESEQPEADR